MINNSVTFNKKNLNQIKNYFYDFNKKYIQHFTYTEEPYFTKDEIEYIKLIGNICLETQNNVATVQVSDGSYINNEKKRLCETSWIRYNDTTEIIYKKIEQVVREINSQIFEFDLNKIETLQYTKYSCSNNGFYSKHIDIENGIFAAHHRKLSFSVQLSDPSEYEGGDLLFHFTDEPVKSPKTLGTVIFFPSYILHEVTPVTKGTRYSLVGWAHGNKLK